MRSQIGKEDNVSKQINQLNKELRTIYTENSDEALVVYFTRSYQKVHRTIVPRLILVSHRFLVYRNDTKQY